MEHGIIAIRRHSRMRSRFNSCIIQEILNISDTFNIRASKNPFVVWVISSNLCIPGTSQIQDMLSIVFNRRKCSRSIPNSPSLIRSEVLQCAIPMLSCVSYCQSKAIRRTESNIGLTCGFERSVSFRIPRGLLFGGDMNICIIYMRI